ncbi:hypothetical protein HNP25_002790 [Arcicella rosea]|uniref:Uncharacterized protein n=1 Tax=Arcicella rosea TaxID=502909 RepID=A0A841EIW2_9BACT|nr:hypothetical protein [Arcicella rosea]
MTKFERDEITELSLFLIELKMVLFYLKNTFRLFQN